VDTKKQVFGQTRGVVIGFILALVFAVVVITAGLRNSGLPPHRVSAALSVEGLPLGDDYPYGSPLAVAGSPDGKVVYVAQHTGQRVDKVNPASGTVVESVALSGAPSGLELDLKGERLFVTYGLDVGKVGVIDTQTGKVDFTLAAGHTPVAPVVSSDGGTLYVCNRFDNELIAYDLAKRDVAGRVCVGREPIAMARTPDDTLLAVANHLPAQAAVSDYVAAKVELICTETLEIIASVMLPNGSTGIRDMSMSQDGSFVYIPHTIGRFGVPTTQLERGWMNTSALSIIDMDKQQWLTTVLLDDVDLGAANPWGIACTADGQAIVVAHSGTHEISIIDRQLLHEKIDRVADGQRVSDVASSLDMIPNDLSFLGKSRQRVELPGNGPRGVAVINQNVAVTQYFSDSLAWVDLDTMPVAVASIALNDSDALCQVRRGERAFHDAKLCFQQWQSCASCHPDARADTLNWDLLNDGIGNPKNTRSMLYTHETPPVMITGVRPNAETAVRAGFKFIQFAVVPEETSAAVDAYLRALRPMPSPYLEDGALSASARCGKELFDTASCGDCHSGQYYTDGLLYDVAIGPDELGLKEFVTPTLVEIWRTAPYLFDGRAETMEEVLTIYNYDDKHGETSELTEEEIADLATYILSL